MTDLRVAAGCAVAACIGAAAFAADRAHSSVIVYGDTDRVQVISPTVAGSVDVSQTTIEAVVSMDLISAASVDLTSAASPKGFEEQRTQADAGFRQGFGDGKIFSAGYHLSYEPDFLSHAVRLGAQRDAWDRHFTFGVNYGYSHASIGRTHDSVFSRERQSHDLDLTVARVLTASSAADFGWGLSVVDGFQANAYRFVRLYAAPTGPHQTAVTEQVPDLRLRQTLSARLRARLWPSLFGLAEYRFYGDSWGMLAHTLTLRWAYKLGGASWTLAAEGRGHLQSAAAFYQARYVTLPLAPDLRTADKELGPMWTALGGLHLEWSPALPRFQALRVVVGADLLHLRYLDYAFLAARTALILSTGVSWEI